MQDEAEMSASGTLSILHVSQPTEGGVAGYVAEVVADQARRGRSVTVACPTWGALGAQVSSAGAKHVEWTAGRAPGPTSFLDAARLARIIAREDPALVHLHSSKAGLAGRLALRGRRPTIFQPHAWSFDAVTGPMHWASFVWEWYAQRWTDRIACVSEHERRRGPRLAEDSAVTVLPNG